MDSFRDAAITAGLDDGALFANISSRTPLELSDGNWTGLVSRLGPTVGESSEARRAAAFRQYNLLSTEGAPSTRGSAWQLARNLLGRQLGDACTESFPCQPWRSNLFIWI